MSIGSKPQDAGERQALSFEPLALNVLVVEDNQLNQLVLSRFLEKMGCRCDVASNGEMALEFLKLDGPPEYDVVLMDIQMPVMDGLEATEWIRASKYGGTIPIIAVTAHGDREAQERFCAKGMNGYLPKPVDWGDLYAALKHHCAV